jgi:hypothetical protein
VGVDSRKYLVRSVEINRTSGAEVYREEYSDYREVEGIPFPARAARSAGGTAYCEAFTPAIEYGMEIPDSVFSIMRADTLIRSSENKAGSDSLGSEE